MWGNAIPICFALPLLLNLLLLTRQSAEHGAVEPKRNELPSFRECWGLSIVPIGFRTIG